MEFRVLLHQLDAFAAQFWSAVANARVFAFHGEMGAGKTTIISALCRYKGVLETISSPTFAIINEYTYQADDAQHSIYHIDLYRLNDREEIMQTGVAECMESGAICFVEWAVKAPFLFDANSFHVVLDTVSEQERRIKILNAAAYHSLSIA